MSWFHWAILSAFFAGVTAVLAKAGTKDIHPNLATAIRTSVVLVLTWGIVFIGGRIEWKAVACRTIVLLTLSGLATGLSWLCYFRAMHLGEASSVAPVDKLSVVFTIAFAAIFLSESLSWHHWIGGSLIVLGTMLIATKS